MRVLRVQSIVAAIVFVVNCAAPVSAQKEMLMTRFGHGKGRYPQARLFEDSDGNLFGTAELGGTAYDKLGTVFEVSGTKHAWTTRAIYNFSLLTGGFPEGGVIRDRSGSLYGTAALGGGSGCGDVYELDQRSGAWVETTLHGFSGDDGCVPIGELVHDSAGNLYGSTGIGGANSEGTVFELSRSGKSWSYAILYNFSSGTDGNRPQGILLDSAETIFGTTAEGGDSNAGTVFELTKSGGAWTETILHSFGGGGDGSEPTGGLAENSAGSLFGATTSGGAYGAGSIFEISPTGKKWIESTLYSFMGGTDGNHPVDGVALYGGALYGATESGGAAGGGGTVFKLTRTGSAWTETVLHNFPIARGKDGTNPSARPIVDKNGVIYGVTLYGARNNYGRVYRISSRRPHDS